MTGNGFKTTIQLGSYSTDMEVYIAPIREEVLLGLDFLQSADVTI